MGLECPVPFGLNRGVTSQFCNSRASVHSWVQSVCLIRILRSSREEELMPPTSPSASYPLLLPDGASKGKEGPQQVPEGKSGLPSSTAMMQFKSGN